MRIRTLTASDASQYRELMLEAYVLAADAFTSTVEDRSSEPESWWVNRIANPRGLSVSFGAEIEGRLVGTGTLEYSSKPKTKHSVLLIGMYVCEPARRKGVGRSILEAALKHAAERPGVQIVTGRRRRGWFAVTRAALAMVSLAPGHGSSAAVIATGRVQRYRAGHGLR